MSYTVPIVEVDSEFSYGAMYGDPVAQHGDAVGITRIHGYTADDDTGRVLAEVICTKRGDITVSYHDPDVVGQYLVQEEVKAVSQSMAQDFAEYVKANNPALAKALDDLAKLEQHTA